MPLSSPVTPRAARALVTRQHLIATTIRVMHERSYGDATLFEVAKAAGVTPGALQHHFGSRAMLMLEVLASILGSSRIDEQLAGAGPAGPPEHRARQFVAVLWKQLYEPPRFLAAWSVYFGAAAEPEIKPRMATMRKQLASTLHQRFARVFPEGAGRTDAKAFTDLVLSSLRGIGVARLFGPDARAEAAQREVLAALIAAWCRSTPTPVRPARARRASEKRS